MGQWEVYSSNTIKERTMPKKEKPLKKVKCKKCGEQWVPRVSTPKKCPGCQTREWDFPLPLYRPVAGPDRRAVKNK